MNLSPKTLALILFAAFAWLLFPGCAADGSFDPVAFGQAADTATRTYERIRYPDRPMHAAPVNPPGAPDPVYP